MRSLNRLTLIGWLGGDPKVIQFPDGNAVARVNLATNEGKRKDGTEITEWHHLAVWGKGAEIASKHWRKGIKLYVEGSVRTRQWVDRNGEQRTATEMVVHYSQILSAKAEAVPDAPVVPEIQAPLDEQIELPSEIEVPF